MNKITILKIDKLNTTLSQKERFNPYVTGNGIYKSKKHQSRQNVKIKLKNGTDII